MKKQADLKNEKIKAYIFLNDLYETVYYPNDVVDKGKSILIDLCFDIEKTQPQDLDELYVLTHAAADKFNDLQDEFYDNDSEIETVARDIIGEDLYFIATAYGYKDADPRELMATSNW
ncbi:DUF5713 family protein [Longitalea luteola]|uniref:DUF5713 family protein n=1 Tax=Longitalea luteola TaxID=2812563 RepID=UPI001A963305|nr:DUF5713 family protein [Longitalea luteola]